MRSNEVELLLGAVEDEPRGELLEQICAGKVGGVEIRGRCLHRGFILRGRRGGRDFLALATLRGEHRGWEGTRVRSD